ncbi:hypothetical protein E2562_035197 [Oryza meyeriana var. granulata]|uniref:Uncharacterized protein n=1 Tax=Oryza meyeriana var. granulata TaxID=110450 RepID=A0A6G1DC89_9ORYZ|nr:hypothetical protein E2562_035197 [Oryza meyeriana var. granulata]
MSPRAQRYRAVSSTGTSPSASGDCVPHPRRDPRRLSSMSAVAVSPALDLDGRPAAPPSSAASPRARPITYSAVVLGSSAM